MLLVKDFCKDLENAIRPQGWSLTMAIHSIHDAAFRFSFLKPLEDGRIVAYRKIVPELVYHEIDKDELIDDIISEMKDAENKRREIPN